VTLYKRRNFCKFWCHFLDKSQRKFAKKAPTTMSLQVSSLTLIYKLGYSHNDYMYSNNRYLRYNCRSLYLCDPESVACCHIFKVFIITRFMHIHMYHSLSQPISRHFPAILTLVRVHTFRLAKYLYRFQSSVILMFQNFKQ
jgi:hypothetical protein